MEITIRFHDKTPRARKDMRRFTRFRKACFCEVAHPHLVTPEPVPSILHGPIMDRERPFYGADAPWLNTGSGPEGRKKISARLIKQCNPVRLTTHGVLHG